MPREPRATSRPSTLLVRALAPGCAAQHTPSGHHGRGGPAATASPPLLYDNREELRWNPENGWSLFGPAQSRLAQGKVADAAAVAARLPAVWVRADVAPTSSHL